MKACAGRCNRSRHTGVSFLRFGEWHKTPLLVQAATTVINIHILTISSLRSQEGSWGGEQRLSLPGCRQS